MITQPPVRVAMMAGSIKPLLSGTDDYTESLTGALSRLGLEVAPVAVGDWTLRGTPSLAAELRRSSPDVVHIQYPTDAFGPRLGPHAAALAGIPCPHVVTLHEFSQVHWARRASVGALVLRASAVIFTTEEERQHGCRWFPWIRKRSEVVPIASNIPFRPRPALGRPTAVTFGQIRPNRGITEFLDAAEAMGNSGADLNFRLIGSRIPKFADFYDQTVGRAALLGVDFHSSPSPEEVAALLGSATVACFLFPDGASPRRSSLLAALGNGVPVVTTCGSQTTAELRRATLTIGDEGGLSSALSKVLGDPSFAASLSAAGSLYARDFTWPSIATRHAVIYARIARRPRVMTGLGSEGRAGT